ncbi:MAG: DUF262 domain-containing protein [Candidatus Aminicenantes bacterium]|nr:DUF262 domain-containing protein [Candidatus Aminicenantes bacterium]NIM77375.1 DUF262 domain-containing protein [Candidatus Aminicenantes bacterium]NIN21334.1 DUF262 domain-containing protein [Candidatus Aminicenantes bacterium]NIN45155.1 DUF262 domain-containing protein [Candidatus Aminicenantes bacterium]NIN87972.1 DUF262 domain-containing protein [Candidatus Aminicenantes bacterium]
METKEPGIVKNMSEDEYKEIDEEKDEIEDDLKEPFDPKDIDTVIEQKSLDSIIARIKHKEIDLNPEFQREGNLWSPPVMSRLIESVLVRFPLPAFYFDASDDDRWLVVDGLQRLYTFKRFVVDCEEKYRDKPENKPLELKGLEFLKDYEGLTFDKLPHRMQRRLKESQITAYFIKPGTPKEVKYSIFYRINTGGLILNAQEIRNALNQDGYAASYLKEVTGLHLFKEIVNVSPKRMQDRELILRHLAFRLHPYKTYKPSMKGFLNEAMKELNDLTREELNQLKDEFISSLETSRQLFGQHAFSKTLVTPTSKPTLNRGLFEVFTVLTAEMSKKEKDKLISHKEKFLEEFKVLLQDRTFDRYITSSTTGRTPVQERFKKVKKLIYKFIRK